MLIISIKNLNAVMKKNKLRILSRALNEWQIHDWKSLKQLNAGRINEMQLKSSFARLKLINDKSVYSFILCQ